MRFVGAGSPRSYDSMGVGMNRKHRRIVGIIVGLLLFGQGVGASAEPLLVGSRHFSVEMESELSSRDVKIEDVEDRLRVARQSLQFTYGLFNYLDLFLKAGMGKITFSESDLESATRPLYGAGLRSTVSFWGGYFTGIEAQYRAGEVSKFNQDDVTLTIEDKWTEQDAVLFFGTKDLLRDPEPDLRLYLGVRYSNREDDLTPEGGTSGTAEQESNVGGIFGIMYTDSKIFRFNTELGTVDQNNVQVRFGLVF